MEYLSFFQNKWPVFLRNGVVLLSLLPLTCKFKSANIKIKVVEAAQSEECFHFFFWNKSTETLDKDWGSQHLHNPLNCTFNSVQKVIFFFYFFAEGIAEAYSTLKFLQNT